MAVNVKSVFLMSKVAIPLMARQGGGAIVNMTADFRNGMPGMGHSGAARADEGFWVAVLPFKNYSGVANQDYFADGISDLLTTELGGIGALTVKSHQSSLKFKDSTKSMPEIGQELHADAIVAGSVLRESSDVTVNVQLIETATDRLLWAKKFEGNVTEVLKMRSEIVEALAREIQTTISPEQSSRLSSARRRASGGNAASSARIACGQASWGRRVESQCSSTPSASRARASRQKKTWVWAGNSGTR